MKFRESGAALCRKYGSARLEDAGFERSSWQDGFRKEVLPQRHFGSRLRSTALSCRNHHSFHPLLHGGLEIDENSAVVGGGNSLLDCMVFGRVARACAKYVLSNSTKATHLVAHAGGGNV